MPQKEHVFSTISVRRFLTAPARRAIAAAEMGFGRRRPNAAECIACAKTFGVAPVVILGRFGYLPSAHKGYKRNIYAYVDRPTCRAVVPDDADALGALMLFQLHGGVVRCELIDSSPA